MSHRFLLGIFRWKDNSRNKLQYQNQQKLAKRQKTKQDGRLLPYKQQQYDHKVSYLLIFVCSGNNYKLYIPSLCLSSMSLLMTTVVYLSLNEQITSHFHYKNTCTGWKGFFKNTYKHKFSLQVITQHEFPNLVKRIRATQWRLAPKSKLKKAVCH